MSSYVNSKLKFEGAARSFFHRVPAELEPSHVQAFCEETRKRWTAVKDVSTHTLVASAGPSALSYCLGSILHSTTRILLVTELREPLNVDTLRVSFCYPTRQTPVPKVAPASTTCQVEPPSDATNDGKIPSWRIKIKRNKRCYVLRDEECWT